ncbi:iron ABC transporter permease [Sedimentitalea todarodis]|uniref:Iron ABC transporter permease n=2 Tax=Sedimentitalea todarodis TaxID=1631240 RepID=A0ABU3V9P9_9RHOB|nr:iron ABC transporter permease [Sedimentitalea todarodis]MDU9002906.1 iron ABC transporter permease [Sedimentitalea todarodis]
MVATVQTSDAEMVPDRRAVARRLGIWLVLVVLVMATASLAMGAAGTSLWLALADLVQGRALAPVDSAILWTIRLPRTIMAILVGAALAVSGAVLQGLFRNPLADPALVGVSSGAALGAISAIVLGAALPPSIAVVIGPHLIPLAAFAGSGITIMVLYRISTRAGRTSVATMLLGGIAIGAMAAAGSGLLIYAADDQQLRDLNFWQLGSLAGSTWARVGVAAPIILIALTASPFLARGLNALALGEAPAAHLGIPVQRLKTLAVLLVAAATGAAVAVSGGIGFVGIVVPHLLRLWSGPDHATLLPNAALLGASLLLAADILGRIVIAPAELPIGIVTAVLGAPVFLWILMQRRAELAL